MQGGTVTVAVTAAQLAQATFVAGAYRPSDNIFTSKPSMDRPIPAENAMVNVAAPLAMEPRAETVSLPSGADVSATVGQAIQVFQPVQRPATAMAMRSTYYLL